LTPALRCSDITLDLDATRILDRVDWEVQPGQHWVVLGPNGAGKTTLLRIAALYQHPTSGTVDVLGRRLGRTDVRTLREHIAFSSPALAVRLEPSMTATEVVMTARHAALEPWWHTYDDGDRSRARSRLDYHRLTPGLLQMLRDDSRENIGARADDDLDRMIWKTRRLCRGAACRQKN